MDVAAWIGLAGNAILLFTMVVFAYQARQMAQQSRETSAATRATVYQGIEDQMLSIDRLFIDRPELRKFIYDDAPVPAEEPMRSAVMALAELFIDLCDNFVAQSGYIPESLYAPWRSYACSVMESSPAVREFWAMNNAWYSDILREMFTDHRAPARADASVREQSAAAWETTESQPA